MCVCVCVCVCVCDREREGERKRETHHVAEVGALNLGDGVVGQPVSDVGLALETFRTFRVSNARI